MDALSLYAQQTRGYDPLAGYQRGVALAGQLLATQAQQQQQVFNNLFQGAQMVNQRRQFEANLAQRQEEVAFNQSMEERKFALEQQRLEEQMRLRRMQASMRGGVRGMAGGGQFIDPSLPAQGAAQAAVQGAVQTGLQGGMGGAGASVGAMAAQAGLDAAQEQQMQSVPTSASMPVSGQGGLVNVGGMPFLRNERTGSLTQLSSEYLRAMGFAKEGEAQTDERLPLDSLGRPVVGPNPLLPGLTPDMEAEAPPLGMQLPATTQPSPSLRTPAEVLGAAPSSMETPATITQAGALAPQEQGMVPLTPDSLALPSTQQTGPSNAELVSDQPLPTQGQKIADPRATKALEMLNQGEVPPVFYVTPPKSDGSGGNGMTFRKGPQGQLQVAIITDGKMGDTFIDYEVGETGLVPLENTIEEVGQLFAKFPGAKMEFGTDKNNRPVLKSISKSDSKDDLSVGGSLLDYAQGIKNEEFQKVATGLLMKAVNPMGAIPPAGYDEAPPEQRAQMEMEEKQKAATEFMRVMQAASPAGKQPFSEKEVNDFFGIAKVPAPPGTPPNPDGSMATVYMQRPKSFTETQKEQEGTQKAQEINQLWTEKKNAIGDEIRAKFSEGLPNEAAVEQELDTLAWDTYFEGGSIGDMVTGLPSDRTFAQERILKRLGYSANAKAFDRKEARFFTKVSNQELLKAWARSRLTERGLLTPEGTRAQVPTQTTPTGETQVLPGTRQTAFGDTYRRL